ncbi:MAG: ABC transporter ATP-binding protein [Bacillota bacterium]|nr:ABC transporter ATP-binding protein [Bacillota bacterium]
MAAEVILDVKNLNTSFITDKQEIKIIKDVSLQLKKGATLAIVGESGCGKTVTVHSIVRLMPQNALITSDHVIYRSGKSGEQKEYRLHKMANYGKAMRSLRGPEISMIFQDPMASLNPVYKIGTQIIEGLRKHNPDITKKEALDKALNMLKQLGVPAAEQRINDYPHQMSGGMKQRVIIAIAMICDPEIIIADEPTTALDVTIQAQIMELMKKLQNEFHKSIILITHNMGLVAEMADEICVMYMGRIVEYGKLRDIFEHPSHPYTKALLESVPVPGMRDEDELVTIPGSTPDPAELGSGCEFADRCTHCMERCREKRIHAYEISDDHWARCLLYDRFKEVD